MRQKKFWFVLVLLLVSLFLRLYHIGQLTTFLGDQGRTGLVIYNAVTTKTLPLAGPPLVTGQYLGPFFYYLVAPSFIISNFNPIAPSIFISLLDVGAVLLLFFLGEMLFSEEIGFIIALLYGTSAYLVTQSRILWEPNAIPFFVMLLIFTLFKLYKDNQKYILFVGLLLGILLQFHYLNLFLFAPAFGVWFYSLLKTKDKQPFFLWTFFGVLGFFIIFMPFLKYEKAQNFVDLKGIFHLILGSQHHISSIPFYQNMVDFSFRLFKYLIAIDNFPFVMLSGAIIIIFPFFVKRRIEHLFFVLFFIAGIFALSLYKGIVYNHYLNFLIPLPFLLFGSFIFTLRKTSIMPLLYILVFFFVLLNLSQTDIFNTGPGDIGRTKEITEKIVKIADGKPFSFTILSPSFSDLNYRYFFTINHVGPVGIASSNYKLLFLVCEKNSCPDKIQKQIQVVCYDPVCSGKYPIIDLNFWKLKDTKQADGNKIYEFIRRK